MGEVVTFDAKQLVLKSKGNNSLLKRLVKEEVMSKSYPLDLLIEQTEDELRQVEEGKSWILFWMGITLMVTLYVNLMLPSDLSPTFLIGNIGLLLGVLLLGVYFKKNGIILSYRLIIDVLQKIQDHQLKAIRLSSFYFDVKHFFQDLDKKIDCYGGECKCYVYYQTKDTKNYYTGYALCETSIWEHERGEMRDTIDKIGVLTLTLEDAKSLFKSQIKWS